jgi:hypothetical protein
MRGIVTGTTRIWLITMAIVGTAASGQATLLQDRGIFLAGPFSTPDIHQPPSASAEAVFVAGSVASAPLFLNELVVASNGSGCEFSNNGWVDGSYFTAHVARRGGTVWISWDFSGTSYALSYISVNFDNNFYHVYYSDPAFRSEGQVAVTGNLRDVISHIHFFGVSTVPDSGATIGLFGMSLGALAFFRRRYPVISANSSQWRSRRAALVA